MQSVPKRVDRELHYFTYLDKVLGISKPTSNFSHCPASINLCCLFVVCMHCTAQLPLLQLCRQDKLGGKCTFSDNAQTLCTLHIYR